MIRSATQPQGIFASEKRAFAVWLFVVEVLAIPVDEVFRPSVLLSDCPAGTTLTALPQAAVAEAPPEVTVTLAVFEPVDV